MRTEIFVLNVRHLEFLCSSRVEHSGQSPSRSHAPVGQSFGRSAEVETKQRELETEIQRDRLETEIQSEKKQLELKAQRETLELIRFRLVIMQRRLDLQERSLDYSFQVAYQIIETLSSKMDHEAKRMLIQDVLPRILQLQSSSNAESIDAEKGFDDGKI